jgi:outer membrane protein TolC
MTTTLKYIATVAVALLVGGVAAGQAPLFLSLDSCRSRALAGNNRSKTAQEQYERMQHEVRAYRANFFPRMAAQGAYLFSTAEMNYRRRFDLYDTGIPSWIDQLPLPDWASGLLDPFYRSLGLDLNLTLRTNHTFLTGLQFEQPLFMGGKITTAYRMAKTARQMAHLNLLRTEAEVLLLTDRAYWQCVKVEELYHAALRYRDAVEQVCRDARNGTEMGLVSENDRMKAEAKRDEAALLLRQAENGKRLAQMNLCMVVGLPPQTAVTPLDSLPDDRTTSLPATADALPEPTARTEYALLEKQVELKRQQVHLVRSDFLPQVAVTGGYYYLNGLRLNDTRLLDNASFSALVSLKIPLTHWSEGAYRVRAAQADLRMAEYQQQESLNLLRLEMLKAYNTLDEALLRTSLARKEYLQTQENRRVVADRYDVGMETLAALLEAQALWQQAAGRYIEAKADLRIAESDYRRVIGESGN